MRKVPDMFVKFPAGIVTHSISREFSSDSNIGGQFVIYAPFCE